MSFSKYTLGLLIVHNKSRVKIGCLRRQTVAMANDIKEQKNGLISFYVAARQRSNKIQLQDHFQKTWILTKDFTKFHFPKIQEFVLTE